MNFFDKIHETQITRRAKRPLPGRKPADAAPLHRRLFPLQARRCDVSRAAAIEVLG